MCVCVDTCPGQLLKFIQSSIMSPFYPHIRTVKLAVIMGHYDWFRSDCLGGVYISVCLCLDVKHNVFCHVFG